MARAHVPTDRSKSVLLRSIYGYTDLVFAYIRTRTQKIAQKVRSQRRKELEPNARSRRPLKRTTSCRKSTEFSSNCLQDLQPILGRPPRLLKRCLCPSVKFFNTLYQCLKVRFDKFDSLLVFVSILLALQWLTGR